VIEKDSISPQRRVIWGKLFANRYVILVFRFILAGTFLLSSAGKLVNIRHYSVLLVYHFGILPVPLAIAFGWALPFIELFCALGLLFGVLTRLSALGIALMGTSFFIAKATVLWQGIDMDCGCFGPIASIMASWSIYLDPAIFLMSLAILLSPPSSRHWVSLGKKLPQKWSDKLNCVW
jgi:putative oxidoreductase